MRLYSLSPLLSLYIIKTYLLWFIGITATIVSVIFLADFVDMLRRIANRDYITFGMAAKMIALRLPFFAQELIPIIALFASMGTLWALTRKQELIVARAAGVSIWQFLLPILLTTMVAGVAFVTLYNPIASRLYKEFLSLEKTFLSTQVDVVSVSKSGAIWIRHVDHEGTIVVKGKPVDLTTKILEKGTLLHFDSLMNLKERFDAEKIIFESGRIRLHSTWHSRAGEPPVFLEKEELFYHVTVNDIVSSLQSADSTAIWDLADYIKHLKKANLPYRDHELRFHHLLSFPILLFVMVLLSAVFSLRLPRKGGTGTLIGAGAATALIIFFFSDVIKAISSTGTLPVIFGVWVPIAIIFCFSVAVLLKTEDG
jgi:lipopolysaccharide export system permease protein